MDVSKIKFLIFDTFGTVVNWHGEIVEEGETLGKKYGISIDWHKFANDWRMGYFEATRAIASGARPWEKIDSVFLKILYDLVEEYGISEMITEEELQNFGMVWHRLKGWKDTVEGLDRLKTKYMIGPFTNGDFRLILDMAKHAKLNWDFIITADIFKKFKPDPSIYVDVVKFLDAKPEEVMMVAAHPFDLDGAVEAGCATAYITRPEEFGPNSGYVEPEGKHKNDVVLADFLELADYLGV